VGSIPIRLRHFLFGQSNNNGVRQNRKAMPSPRVLRFRPARWSIFGYRVIALMLIAAGTWAMVYGGFVHRIPIIETHEEEVSEAEPVVPPPMNLDPSGTPGMMPPGDIPFPPPEDSGPGVKFVTRIKTTQTTTDMSEPGVNRLVAIGGLTRNSEGEILRVVVAASGPAFCPT
jgi:hypothetical protein